MVNKIMSEDLPLFNTQFFWRCAALCTYQDIIHKKIMSILYKLNMHIDLHFFQDLHFAFVAEKTCKSIQTSAIIF